MIQILVAVDDFTEAQFNRMENSVRGWGSIRRIPQNTPEKNYRAKLRDAGIVIGWPDPQWLLGSGAQLVQIGSSGWDAYEHRGLEEAGIAICSGRGIYSIGVAEHCIAMMFALSRRLPVHVRDKQQKIFCRHAPYMEVAGSTACIVGLGSIGMELASRCNGLGMRVIGVARDSSKDRAPVKEIFPVSELKTAIRQADHVFMTASGDRRNQNLFSREVLEAFAPTSCFYNVSRGSTVDEAALSELLADGKIAGAGLDVTLVEPLPVESPLWSLDDNVIITGHSAGISQGYTDRFCDLAIRNMNRFRRGEALENRVI